MQSGSYIENTSMQLQNMETQSLSRVSQNLSCEHLVMRTKNNLLFLNKQGSRLSEFYTLPNWKKKLDFFFYPRLRMKLPEATHRNCMSMLRLCRKFPPNARQSTGVNTEWIHPGKGKNGIKASNLSPRKSETKPNNTPYLSVWTRCSLVWQSIYNTYPPGRQRTFHSDWKKNSIVQIMPSWLGWGKSGRRFSHPKRRRQVKITQHCYKKQIETLRLEDNSIEFTLTLRTWYHTEVPPKSMWKSV